MELEKMIDNVIRRYGFESNVTIGFCKMVEDYQKNPKNYKLAVISLTYEEILG